MEMGTIERELYIDAAPAVVFDVVSRPEHVANWWADDAHYDVVPGASGELTFVDHEGGGLVNTLTVLEVDPPHTFSFRWTHPAGDTPTSANSFLVTFTLTPSGDGTRLRLTETGFRERGWEAAVLEEHYRDHVSGWDRFLPALVPYAEARR